MSLQCMIDKSKHTLKLLVCPKNSFIYLIQNEAMDKINQFQILILRDGKLKKIVCVLLHTKNKLYVERRNYFLTTKCSKTFTSTHRNRKKRTPHHPHPISQSVFQY